jgi:spermidine synthase
LPAWAADGVREIEFGVANLAPFPFRPGAWVLWIDGVAQSYVDLVDPHHLEFPYMRRVAAVFDTVAPAGRPLRALHLGGGAYTLPRYLAATRPGSAQTVVERDAKLAALVDEMVPLPDESGIDIRIADARGVVEETPPGTFDLVVADAYEAGRMADSVATAEFVAAAYEVLAPGGAYIVNVTDLPPLAFSRRQVATVSSVFPDVCLLTETSLLRGRRYGNVVIAGRRPPRKLPVARMVRHAHDGGVVLHGAGIDEFMRGARPLVDAEVD